MRHAAIHIILILSALIAAVGVHGQSYPVQTNLYVLAPYSQTYSDYYADGQQRMYVSILLNDMTQGQLDVVLRFSIKGSNLRLTSNPVSPAKPITIQSGKLCRVEGTELAQFLKADCMLVEGRLADEFMKSGRLPEGHYDIKVEVVEFYRKARVSAPAYSTAWIVQPEPPVWTMPQKDAVLEATSPQYVLFGWMMTGNTTLLQNLRYTFSIYEKPTGVSADVAVKATAPIYSEELTQAMLIYGPDKPLLELGKTYACRVRVSDADNRASFKNDGYSEALAFRYGQECLPPAQPTVTDITGKGATLNWVSNQTQSGYDIEVRETTEGRGSDWYVWKLDRPAHDYTIRQLSPGSRYECRVAATCGQRGNGIRSPYSPTVTFATQAARSKVYECGGIAEDAAPTDLAPWPYLEEGEEITSAGFPFRILSISKNSGGIFSGQCAWQMPLWKISILCDFTDITVNFERQLLSGTITATHDRERAMAFSRIQRTAYEPIGTQVPVTFKAEKTVTAQQPVDSILVANGRTLIYMAGREPVRIDATDNVLVKSPDGNYYAVCGGKVYPKPSNMDGDGNVELSYTQQYAATFGRGATGPHHGLDNYTEEKKPFAAQYSRYLLHNSEACAAWMALPTGKTDFVLATVDGDRTYMHFRHNGQEMQTIPAPDNGHAVYLPVTDEGLYEAYYTTPDKHGHDVDVVAGQLNVAAYDETVNNLCIVGVNGERYPGTTGELSGYLNEVFGQAVKKVSATTANIDVDKFNGTLSAKESSALSAYNSDMKKLIKKVKKLPDYNSETYYIMLVERSDDQTLGGFMPVNSNFGFVFAKANSGKEQLNRTIAHELAHGAFCLWHTFSSENPYTAQQGTTRNLMDYNGTNAELYKYQWDYIHNPQEGVVRWMVDDEEGDAKVKNVVFSKLKDVLPIPGEIGNRYGYDDMETEDEVNDDHVSVKAGDVTYLGLNQKIESLANVIFVSSHEMVTCECVANDVNTKNANGKKATSLLKISAQATQQTINATIYAITTTKEAWSELSVQERQSFFQNNIGQINVDVYSEIEIEKTIYYDSELNIDEGKFTNEADKNLKYFVAKSKFKYVKKSDFDLLDKDGNGYIDVFKNVDDLGLEAHSFNTNITYNNNYSNEILLLNVNARRDCWQIKDAINKSSTTIQLPKTYCRIFSKASPNDLFSIAKPDGKNEEVFVITSVDDESDVLTISKVDVNTAGDQMSTTNMPFTNLKRGFDNLHDADEIITEYGKVDVGGATTNPDQPIIVYAKSYDDTEVLSQIAVHEALHAYKLDVFYDVNKPGNIMHYITNEIKETKRTETMDGRIERKPVVIPIDVPFRFKKMEECETGTGTTKLNAKFKSQWNDARK